MTSNSTDVQRFPMRRGDITVLHIDGETVLTETTTGTQHQLNPTAQALWELCDGSTRVEEMIDAILLLFAVERGVVRDDVTRALSQLTDLGLVEWR
jgi:hypothetical protein